MTLHHHPQTSEDFAYSVLAVKDALAENSTSTQPLKERAVAVLKALSIAGWIVVRERPYEPLPTPAPMARCACGNSYYPEPFAAAVCPVCA